MKKKTLYRALASFCVTAMLVANSIETFAATTFLPTADVSVSSDRKLNITAGKDKDLFSNMKDVMPGDVRSNTVAINNESSQDLTFYLKAYPGYQAVSGDGHSAVRGDNKVTVEDKEFLDDLLSVIGMKVTFDGTVIFEGKADGSPQMTEGDYGIKLGTVAAKTSQELVVEITLPGAEMDNEFMNSFGAVDWVFIAEGKDTSGGGDHGGGDDDDGGGSGGNRPGGNPGDRVEVVNIDDGDVPLANMGDSDVNIEIVDGQVPLASLAKTGGGEYHLAQMSALLLFLLVGLAAVSKARKSYNK